MIVLYVGRKVLTPNGEGTITSIYRKNNNPIQEDVVVKFKDGSSHKFRDEELKAIPQLDDFLKKVMERLHRIAEIDSAEIETIQCTIKQCYERGFSIDDAVAYLSYTEEVSPQIPEEIALKRLNAISKKYPTKTLGKKE